MISTILGTIGAAITLYSTLSLIAMQIKPRKKNPVIEDEMEKLLLENGYVKLEDWRAKNGNSEIINNDNKDNSEK